MHVPRAQGAIEQIPQLLVRVRPCERIGQNADVAAGSRDPRHVVEADVWIRLLTEAFDQQELVEPALAEARDAATCWAVEGITEAMNRYNRRSSASA